MSIVPNWTALGNRNRVFFHQENIKPYTSLKTLNKLSDFKWDVLNSPPYSPDLAPSDYQLFRSLQNHLNGKRFDSYEACEIEVSQFFSFKSQKFYEEGIMKLPERCQEIIDNNGQHITE